VDAEWWEEAQMIKLIYFVDEKINTVKRRMSDESVDTIRNLGAHDAAQDYAQAVEKQGVPA
jgi:hypothetical protein